jgi:hypothetical protein
MNLELRFSDKQITPWGGMAIMKRLLDHLGFESALPAADLPAPSSNRGYSPEQLVTQFMLSVWCGANRFEHGEVTRHDPVLQKLFGFKRMANFKAIIRYGKQEGAAKGDNPRKPGRLSHHPLMAFVADTRMIANCWLRPGHTGSANHVQGFLANTLHRLSNQAVCLVRADSGFCEQSFLVDLENRALHYVIALRQHQGVQRALVDQKGWWALTDEEGRTVPGIELVRFSYQALSWDKPRWVVGIRQHQKLRENAKGKTWNLFADDPVIGQWRYSALVTDLDLPAQSVWRLYRGRADGENRIKELKYDFAADSFHLHQFWATEAALNTVMLAYNLMSLLRQVLLKTSNVKHSSNTVQHTLQTLRYQLFAKPAYLTTESRKPILNLVIAMQQRAWIQGLWDASKTFELPAKFKPIYSP